MKRCSLIIVILLLIPLCCNAQWRYRFLRHRYSTAVNDETIVAQYGDSLKALKEKIFSCGAIAGSMPVDAPKLLMPLTFYDNVARKAFTPGDSLSFAEEQMLSVYLTHPEWISQTETMLQNVGTPVNEPQSPIQHRADYTGRDEPVTVEPSATPVQFVLKKPNFWSFTGDYSLQFMQNYVSENWYKGGESNYAALGTVTMEANFNNKQKVKWDNKLELRFGMQNTKSDSVHRFKTTDDLIRLTSKFGLQALKKWYYTLQMIVSTQFTNSFKSNDPVLYSDFLAPLNLNVSIGMDYNVDCFNSRLTGTIHIAPFAYNMKYSRLLELSERLGIDGNRHIKNDFGSECTVDLTWKLLETLQWKTRLYAFTSYERAELEWENTLAFQFNRWLSTQLYVYPRFDDGVARDGNHGYWQFKEFASIGFQYSF